jgi:hypothetical protein
MTRSGTIEIASDRTYDVVVARPGFKTLHQQAMRTGPQWSFTLEPEPLRLSISTAEKEGSIFIDNNEKGALQGGRYATGIEKSSHSLSPLRPRRRRVSLV